MKRFLTFSLIILFGMMSNFAQAQTADEPLTPENASQLTQVARLGNGAFRDMAFSADAARFAAATTLGVWLFNLNDPANGRLHEGQGGAWSVSLSPDGVWMAGGGDDGSVVVWNAETGEQVARLENHLYPISALAWSPGGRQIASGDWSGVVRVWDVAAWREYRVFESGERVERLSFAGAWLIATGGSTRTIWEILRSTFISQTQHEEDLGNSAELTVDERSARREDARGTVEIWDNGERIAVLDGFYGALGGAFFTGDGRVGAYPLAEAHLWSLESGARNGAPPPVTSPDGTRTASFGNDGVIRVTDATSGELIAALHGHIRKVNAVAFSADGRLLVSASDDGTLRLWDAAVTEDSGSLATLRGHTSGATSVAFNRSGTLIASTGYDGTLRLWGLPPS